MGSGKRPQGERVLRRLRLVVWDPRIPTISSAIANSTIRLVSVVTWPLAIALDLAAAIGFSRAVSRRIACAVGSDGIVLRSKRDTTFIRLAEIETVTIEKRKVHNRIAYELGHVLRLSRCRQEVVVAGPRKRLERIRSTIEAARAEQKGLGSSIDTVGLERGARGATEWLEYLQALGQGALSTYRLAPPNRDHLWTVVEAAGAAPALRAAAAVALGRLDTTDRKRLAKTAHPTACLPLRTVFAVRLGKRTLSRRRLAKLLAKLESVVEEDAATGQEPGPMAAGGGSRWYERHRL